MQLCIVWLNCGMYTETHHCSLKGDFPSPAIHINPLLQSLNVKVRVMIAVQRAYVCVHAHILVHVIECAELLTSSRGGALMSSVPWKRPTPHVQGDWFCPVPWHTSASDGLTGPWRRTSSLLCLFFFLLCMWVLINTKLIIVCRSFAFGYLSITCRAMVLFRTPMKHLSR